ncbi:putative type VI secretion system effector [Gilliamella sp. ESL0405]|uniref:putative type VI secretion system effector n=1 Tax=Gilliamella sp. ESL0405 TaxID=2704653 RepID=UPI001C6A4BE5|nr:putative type VI secretion system effector [Gilliamella sp. ESL0405]QYN47559.1 hypothetical protein GYM74_10280 [Gilliamella sp. ESL0405]
MNKETSNYYQIIIGKITELEVIDTNLNLFGKGTLANLPILGQLAFGNTTEATSQIGMATGQEEAVDYLNSVQYFRCKIGHLTVQGIFCRAFFRNGDQVEVVVEPLEDGSYYAYALRRPIDHRLWLYPWAMKGTKASSKKAFKGAGIFTLCMFIGSLILYLCLTQILWIIAIFIGTSLIFHGLIFLFLFWLYKNILGGGSKEADKIFATLGYPEPKNVDMEEEYMEMFFNNKSMNEPDFYIDVTTDEFNRKDPAGVKWVAFYREAPTIPDYITVIHTEIEKNKPTPAIGNTTEWR